MNWMQWPFSAGKTRESAVLLLGWQAAVPSTFASRHRPFTSKPILTIFSPHPRTEQSTMPRQGTQMPQNTPPHGSSVGGKQWNIYRSIQSWYRAATGNISSILPISTFMCIFIYAYLHKNNVRRSLILLNSTEPSFYSPYPVARSQAPLLNKTSFFISILPFITHFLLFIAFIGMYIKEYSFRLLLLNITSMLCKKKKGI